MNALIIENKAPKVRRITRAVVGVYFTAFCGYFVFNEAAINRYGVLFFTAVIGAFLALILFLCNTLWASSKDTLIIDNTSIESNVPSSKFRADWVSVSKVSIGVSYIVFFVDGGRKQRKLDLSLLYYNEVGLVKSKVIELCEYKSIPYIND